MFPINSLDAKLDNSPKREVANGIFYKHALLYFYLIAKLIAITDRTKCANDHALWVDDELSDDWLFFF